MEKITAGGCLLLTLLSFGGAILIAPPPPLTSEQVVFSRDLDPQFTPCRETSPCECGTQEDFARAELFRRPCPVTEEPLISGQCGSIDGECVYNVNNNISCVSWRPSCSSQYTCTTEQEYQARDNSTCFRIPAPTPDRVCVPQDGRCERYNPCTIWQGHCNGGYNCGSRLDYGRFIHGPIPFCLPFNPNRVTPQPQGECLYRDGQCQWSECRAWLGHCQTSWRCGSEYDFLVFQSEDPPVCANPGPFFRPPIVPGVCKFNLTTRSCAFRPECEGGKEYTDCGSACPRTCETEFGTDVQLFCPAVCVRGCFCPNNMVLHNNGSCIKPSECPNASPCVPNPCGENQECEAVEIPCEREPCAPPLARCVDQLVLEVTKNETVLVVKAKLAGARIIKVIVRDSGHSRHTRSVRGSSLSEKFLSLPTGYTRVRAVAKTVRGDKKTSDWKIINL